MPRATMTSMSSAPASTERWVPGEPASPEDEHRFSRVERVFVVLQILTACAVAFAHGSNDVANAIGPVAAVISIARTGLVEQASPVPIWILLLGGFGIVLGLGTFGRHVIATVGDRITGEIKKLERKVAQLNKKLRTLEKQQAA